MLAWSLNNRPIAGFLINLVLAGCPAKAQGIPCDPGTVMRCYGAPTCVCEPLSCHPGTGKGCPWVKPQLPYCEDAHIGEICQKTRL
jgi:hypothetical protein